MGKIHGLIILLTILFYGTVLRAEGDSSLKLWYQQPANASVQDSPNGWIDDPEWLKALPLGNGSLGVMVFGDVNKERIQLNEESMWSGSRDNNDNPASRAAQAKIRQLLFDGKYKEATELTNKTQICIGKGSGHGNGAEVPFGCFQTLGDLWIENGKTSSYKNYYRELDLNDAVARVRYTQDGVNFQREIFTSQPDQVMVARFTADKPGQISFKCSMDRPERFETYTDDNQLIMSGALSNGKGGNGLQYMARLKAVNKNGSVHYTDSTIIVENADEVILFLSASTDYLLNYPEYKGRAYKKITSDNISQSIGKPYNELFASHVKEYQTYFKRVNLDLTPDNITDIPTDLRIDKFKRNSSDPHLAELLFQYGRYLLISSSRPGTLPANLQGIWANKIQTPWNGDYHTDVNVEMNYWPAEVTNLSEMHLPLFDLIESLVKPGSKTAQIHYGNKGWVVHPITNVWGFTSPGEVASWGMHTGGSAWICSHIGEHYLYTGDKDFLRRMYPVLKGATEFYLDWLVEDPKTGKLVSGPAVSPENSFKAPDGSVCQISMGPAHDQQVIWQLLADFIFASEELEMKNKVCEQAQKVIGKLAGPQIGSDGRLMEWAYEFPEVEPGHRHISHLFALHPGRQISMGKTPSLAKAAKKSLDYRIANGGGHTGWSAAWLISQYARLNEAEKAKESLNTVLSKSTAPNLFGLHPPFQMDANFGATAGIAEMLIRSEDGLIHLLPALPEEWGTGEVKGLKAHGNVEIDMKWNNGELVTAQLKSRKPCRVMVKYKQGIKELELKANKKTSFGREALKSNIPSPYGVVPTTRQVNWHNTEFYAFLHFSINTFTNEEWGFGDKSPELFNPTGFDAAQIVSTCKEAGMKGLILTCKHHDGFCLWPTGTTEHDISNSLFKNGNGDIVREISDECRKQGLKFGVYLSPWDRNHPEYGKPGYVEVFRAQLKELLTNYGEVFEVWFDGANGGTGYYGGANEKREIDRVTYYGWDDVFKMIRELQPNATIFSDMGPDIRWVGNEEGFSGDPCWHRFTPKGREEGVLPAIGQTKYWEAVNGHREGEFWMPAEVNVSIRPGWFYHASEDDKVKSTEKLLEIYYKSIGRGTTLNLNIPPDRRGIIHESDVKALRNFKEILDKTFSVNLAEDAKLSAGNVRGKSKKFEVFNVMDGDPNTYWATDDGVRQAELIVDFQKETAFNVVDVREYIPLGQRIWAWGMDRWENGHWVEFAKGESIGRRRLWRGSLQKTTKMRFRIDEAPVCPVISELSVHLEPVRLDAPVLSRNRSGMVSIESNGEIRYTTDGGEPTKLSPIYNKAFDFSKGGVIKAKAYYKEKSGNTAIAHFNYSKNKWKILSCSSELSSHKAYNVLDENKASFWQSRSNKGNNITIDLGEELEFNAFTMLPRQDRKKKGIITHYEFLVSQDGESWQKIKSGEFSNIENNPIEQKVNVGSVKARYIQLKADKVIGGEYATIAELGVMVDSK